MRFILFVIDDQSNSAKPGEMQAIDAFNDSLRENGHWIYAAGIGSPTSATIFDNRDSAGVIEAGSLYPATEHYSGFWLIEADSLETAKALAASGSLACNRRVELRPFLGQ